MYFRPGRSNTVTLLHYGSIAIISGYTVCMSYRCGVLKKILNPTVYNKVEHVVEKLKEKTTPIGDANRLSLLQGHLLKSYSYTFTGMACLSAGVAAFINFPRFPLVISLAAAAIPGVIVAAMPRSVIQPKIRQAFFYVSWFFAGYTLGPVGWVAQDALATYVLVTTSTVIGVTVPLYLTRGMLSYVLSSYLLTVAMSTYVVTSSTSTATLFGIFKTHRGVQQILHSDLNGMLFMQLISNITIQSFHTFPKMRKFIMWKGTDDALCQSQDPLFDAHTICSGWVYIGYRMVRGAFHRVLKRLSGKDSEGSISAFSADSKTIKNISSISSGLIIGVVYFQVISRLQQGDIEGTLTHMRDFFQRIAPRVVPSRYG